MSKTQSSLLILAAWLFVGVSGFALALWVIVRGLHRLRDGRGEQRIRRDSESARVLAALGFTPGDRHEPARLHLLERSWPAHRAAPVTVGLCHVKPLNLPGSPAATLEAMDVSITAYIGRRVGFSGIAEPVWQSVLLVRTGGQRLPRFMASPRGRGWFVPRVMGAGRSMVLSGHPELARGYRWQAEDEATTVGWWTSARAAALVALPERAWLETLDDALLVYRRGRVLAPEEWVSWCEVVARLAAGEGGGPNLEGAGSDA